MITTEPERAPGDFMVSFDEPVELCAQIIQRCRVLESKLPADQARIYFSGEYDSSQTRFERDSNHLRVGVVAKSPEVGMVMLFLLRVVIDQRPDFLTDTLAEIVGSRVSETSDEDPSSAPVAFSWLWTQVLATHEEQYSCNFSLHEQFRQELHGWKNGTTVVTADITTVDLWTLPRLEAELEDVIDH